VHTLEKPSCICEFENQLNEVGRAIYKWTFHSQPFPYSWFDLCSWHIQSEKNAVSIWLSCNASESIRKEFDQHNAELEKSILRLGRLEKRLEKISPELAKSDRAKELLDDVRGLIEVKLALMHGFLSDLSRAFGWNREKIEVASKNDKREVVDASRPEEASLPEAALKAIVDGGMAGLLNEAGKLPAAQRYSKTMMEMLKDSCYYAWTVEDWVTHLGAGKKTVLETDAWDHIKRWREENKRERLGE
jgi:hypothetical protein